MKKYLHLLFVALFATASVSFTSCGSDDDNGSLDGGDLWQGELAAPKYESDAVAYSIIDSDEFSSIELTASGNYIVLSANYADYAPAAKKLPMFRAASKVSRAYHGGNKFGSYTKNADGTYNLEGFGTLGAYYDGNLDLTLVDGTEYSLKATITPNIENNNLNNRFCRTWYIQKAVVNVLNNSGNVIESETITGDALKEDYVQYIVVTKAGTFIQVDWDGEFEDEGVWSWVDTKNQVFQYYWKGYPGEGWTDQVTFNGDQATFIEKYVDYDEDGEECIIQSISTCKAQ